MAVGPKVGYTCQIQGEGRTRFIITKIYPYRGTVYLNRLDGSYFGVRNLAFVERVKALPKNVSKTP